MLFLNYWSLRARLTVPLRQEAFDVCESHETYESSSIGHLGHRLGPMAGLLSRCIILVVGKALF